MGLRMHTRAIVILVFALCHRTLVRSRELPTRVVRATILLPTFDFDAPSTMLTCEPATIQWTYQANTLPDPLELTMFITNQNVAQPPPPPSTSIGTFNPPGIRRADSFTQQLVANLDPSLRTFTWDVVNVTAGWYGIIATLPLLPSFIQTSFPFFVENSSDVSCVSPHLSSSPSSTIFDPTSGTSPGGSITTGGASTSSTTTIPITSVSSKVNRGAIVGGVIGGLAVVAAGIAAYFHSRCSSRGRRSRKWAVLSPTDFQAKAYPLASHSISRSPHDSDSSAASSYPGSDTMSLGVGYDSSQPPTPAYPSGTSQALAAAYTGYVNETINGPPLGAPHTDTLEYNLIDPVLVSPPPIAQDSDSDLWLEGSTWNRHSDLGS